LGGFFHLESMFLLNQILIYGFFCFVSYSLGFTGLVPVFVSLGLWNNRDMWLKQTEMPLESILNENPNQDKEWDLNDNRSQFKGIFNQDTNSSQYWFGKSRLGDNAFSSNGTWGKQSKNMIKTPAQKEAERKRQNRNWEKNYQKK